MKKSDTCDQRLKLTGMYIGLFHDQKHQSQNVLCREKVRYMRLKVKSTGMYIGLFHDQKHQSQNVLGSERVRYMRS